MKEYIRSRVVSFTMSAPNPFLINAMSRQETAINFGHALDHYVTKRLEAYSLLQKGFENQATEVLIKAHADLHQIQNQLAEMH